MNRNHVLLKSGIAYTIAALLTSGISFITTPFFTRTLSPSEYGAYSNFISWASIISIIITLQASASFISARFDFHNDFNSYIFSLMVLNLILTFIIILSVSIYGDKWSFLLKINKSYINILLLYCMCNEFIRMYQIKAQYNFEYKKAIFVNCFVALFSTILSFLFVINFDNKLSGRIWGYTLPVILVGTGYFISYFKRGIQCKIAYWKYAIPILLPYIPHALSLTLLNAMDRIMITWIRGEEENALYSLAYLCSSIVTIPMASMNNAYSPWLANKLENKQYESIYSFSRFYILFFITIVMGIMLIAPECLLLLGGDSYAEAVFAMPPVMIGCVYQFLYTMYVCVEQFKKKTVGMAIASVLAACINGILNTYLIPIFGYIAAAYTTLVSYFILLVFHMFLVAKLHIGKIYDYKVILSVIVGGIGVTIIMTVLYHVFWLRCLILALYILELLYMAFKYKDKIKYLFLNR